MKQQRAQEIENNVFYRNLDLLEHLEKYGSISTQAMFYLGRAVGIMQESLKRELDKEVRKGGETNEQ